MINPKDLLATSPGFGLETIPGFVPEPRPNPGGFPDSRPKKGDLDTSFGASDYYFGDADLSYARGTGKNVLQILEYLNNNINRLGETNRPGGKNVDQYGTATPGLYDRIVSEAADYREQERLRGLEELELSGAEEIKRLKDQNKIDLDKMAASFGEQMSAFQKQMGEQQKKYEDNLSQMTKTMTASMNPNTRESVMGIRGAGGATPPGRRRGVNNLFSRQGLRIKSLNV